MDPVEAIGNSVRETDRLALRIFRLLETQSAEDRRLVLNALKSDTDVLAPRAHLVRCSIERFESECGGKVSKQRYEKWRVETADRSIPSASYIAKTHGGSWSKAMDAVGKQPALEHAAFRLRARGRSPEDDEVLGALSLCAQELNVKTLRFGDYRRWAQGKQPHLAGKVNLLLSNGSFTKRFGSFTRACVLAGLEVVPGRLGPWAGDTRYSDESAVEALLSAREEVVISEPLTQARYDVWRKEQYALAAERGELISIPSFLTIRNIFGSWPEALRAAGLLSQEAVNNHARGRGVKMSPVIVAEGLLRATDALGSTFTVRAYDQWRAGEIIDVRRTRPPSVTLLKRTFGNWPSVLSQIATALDEADPLNALTIAALGGHNGQ